MKFLIKLVGKRRKVTRRTEANHRTLFVPESMSKSSTVLKGWNKVERIRKFRKIENHLGGATQEIKGMKKKKKRISVTRFNDASTAAR